MAFGQKGGHSIRPRGANIRSTPIGHCMENYLEGFHISVHPALSRAVDVKAYRTVFSPAVRQTAWACDGDLAFAEGAIRGESGQIAADYWWIYPNLMLNVYPWGISVNVVLPEAIGRTKVISKATSPILPSARAARVARSTPWKWKTRPSWRPCSAARPPRASTAGAAIRPRKSRARITFTACLRRRWREDRVLHTRCIRRALGGSLSARMQ